MSSVKEIAARAKLINEYLAAYRLANPTLGLPEVRYANGWFYLKTGAYESKHRRTKLETMRDNLLTRAADKAAAPNEEKPSI